MWVLFNVVVAALDYVRGTGSSYIKDACVRVADIFGQTDLC